MSIVHVPVTNAVRKYLLKEYANFVINENGKQIIQLHRKYFLGNFLATLMTDNLETYRIYNKPEVYVTFKLSRGFEKSWMPEEQISKLAYHLEHLFKNEFCKFIAYYHSFGISISEAMDNFYDHYDLHEDDYGKDAMRRYYNRYGAEGSEFCQEKKFKKVSGSCPENLDKTRKKQPVNSKFQRMKTEFALLNDFDLKGCTFLSLRMKMIEHRANLKP